MRIVKANAHVPIKKRKAYIDDDDDEGPSDNGHARNDLQSQSMGISDASTSHAGSLFSGDEKDSGDEVITAPVSVPSAPTSKKTPKKLGIPAHRLRQQRPLVKMIDIVGVDKIVHERLHGKKKSKSPEAPQPSTSATPVENATGPISTALLKKNTTLVPSAASYKSGLLTFKGGRRIVRTGKFVQQQLSSLEEARSSPPGGSPPEVWPSVGAISEPISSDPMPIEPVLIEPAFTETTVINMDEPMDTSADNELLTESAIPRADNANATPTPFPLISVGPPPTAEELLSLAGQISFGDDLPDYVPPEPLEEGELIDSAL